MEIAQGNQYLLVLNREKGLGLSQVLAGERRMQEASPAGWVMESALAGWLGEEVGSPNARRPSVSGMQSELMG